MSGVILFVLGLWISSVRAEPRSRRPVQSDDPNLYEILELSVDCAADQIRKSFKRFSREFHPDRAPMDKKDEFAERFKWVAKAYEVLKDPKLRAGYDQTGLVDPQYHRENSMYQRNARAAHFDDGTTPIVDIASPSALEQLVGSGNPVVVIFWNAELELKDGTDVFKSFATAYSGVVRTAQFSCESFPVTCRRLGMTSQTLPQLAVLNPRTQGKLITKRTADDPLATLSPACFKFLTKDTAPIPHVVDGVSPVVPPVGPLTITTAVRHAASLGPVARARAFLAADAAGVAVGTPTAPPFTAFPFDSVTPADVLMSSTRDDVVAFVAPHLAAAPRPGTDVSELPHCPTDGSAGLLLVRVDSSAPPLSHFVDGIMLRTLFQGLALRDGFVFASADCAALRARHALQTAISTGVGVAAAEAAVAAVAADGGASTATLNPDATARGMAICNAFARGEDDVMGGDVDSFVAGGPLREEWTDSRRWVGGYAVGVCGLGAHAGTPTAHRNDVAVSTGVAPVDVAADAFDLVGTVPAATQSVLSVAKLVMKAMGDGGVASWPSHLTPQPLRTVAEFQAEVLTSDEAWLVAFSAGDWCSWCVWMKNDLALLPLTLPDVADVKGFDLDNVRVGIVTCMPHPPGHGMNKIQQRTMEYCRSIGVYSFPRAVVYPVGQDAKTTQKTWHDAKRHAVYLSDTLVASATPVDMEQITTVAAMRNAMAATPTVPAGDPPVSAYAVMFTAGQWCGPCTYVAGWWPVAAQKVAERFPSQGVRMATVDCDAHRDVCNSVHVTSYPQIMLRIPGDHKWYELSGERNPDGVSEWIAATVFAPVLHVQSFDALKANVVGNLPTPVLILFTAGDWCPPCTVAKKAYATMATLAARTFEWGEVDLPPQNDTAATRAFLKGHLPFYQVNCDEMRQACASFQISSYPDLVARDKGSELRKLHYDASTGWDPDTVLKWAGNFFGMKVKDP